MTVWSGKSRTEYSGSHLSELEFPIQLSNRRGNRCQGGTNSCHKESTTSSETSKMRRDSTRYSPLDHPIYQRKLKRRYVVGIGVALILVIAICIIIVIANKKDSLYPEDPEVAPKPSWSKERSFRRGAVCSDGPPCANVGKGILSSGGSAVDAAIATLICNGLVSCQSMGLGGGFLMTIYKRDEQKVYVVDARETAAGKANSTMFGKDKTKANTGGLSVGIPGEMAGYWMAHERFGKLPWKSLVQPTIEICENGYKLSKHQYDSLFLNPRIKDDPTLRSIYVDESTGDLHKVGMDIHHKELCKTLRVIASEGGPSLYKGPLANKLVQDIQSKGGIITEKDLADYKPRWEEPISIPLRGGLKLHTIPPPGSGILVALIINILDGYKFTNRSIANQESTILTYHRIIESFKYAFAARTKLGDPGFVQDMAETLSQLTSREYADIIRGNISDGVTNNDPKSYGADFFTSDDDGTAHVSLISPDGDAISVTSSINFYFGAGFASPQTGIILNNVMDDFSNMFNNHFNLPGSPANRIAPGKRPMSSMSPVIITDANGDARMVIGASGGTKIISAVAYVIMRYFWFGESIKEAVDAPRIHHQLFPMEVSYEYGVTAQIIKGLKEHGHKTSRYKDRGSIACAIARKGEKLLANADYRKGGDVFGID